MKRAATFLLFLALMFVLVAGFIFTLNNTAPVALWLGTDLAPKPLGLWMLLAFIAGGLIGLVLGLGLLQRFRSRLELRQVRARLQQTEQELAVLKQRGAAQAQHAAGGK